MPPPPSPPQLKEAAQLDGVPRPNSVDRVLHPDGTQHISHEAHNKVREINRVLAYAYFAKFGNATNSDRENVFNIAR